MRFTEQFVREAIKDIEIKGSKFPEEPEFSVDTRTLQAGDIFVALKGLVRDGHDFVAQACKKGAAGLIISADEQAVLSAIDKKILDNMFVLIVPNVLNAFVALAAAWRAQFDYPVVAITGSVGKTSTKEILAKILGLSGMPHIASQGNQNTHVGVALNIFRMRNDHKAAIFEVGISQRGEMADITKMLRPTTAIITNIGHCHMEGLGSLVDIAVEKRDVFKYFSEDSIGIVNGDQAMIAGVSYPHPVIKFGSKTTNQIQARKINVNGSMSTFVLKIYKEKHTVTLEKPHIGAVFNALAATAAAHLLGVDHAVIIKGIQLPVTIPGRFEKRTLKAARGTVINDSYNANPESMKAALLAFQKVDTDAKKIAVLGDMLELGTNSPFWHRQLGRFLRKVPSLKHVILVGDMVEWTKKTAPVHLTVEIVPTWDEAQAKLEQQFEKEALVLIKGSFGVGLGNLVDTITETQ